MEDSKEMQEWHSRFGWARGMPNWNVRHSHAMANDIFIELDIAPVLKEKGIDFFYELSHSGTCYLCANGVKIRLSDHEIDNVNYDLQVLWPGESDAEDIINYILYPHMRSEIELAQI